MGKCIYCEAALKDPERCGACKKFQPGSPDDAAPPMRGPDVPGGMLLVVAVVLWLIGLLIGFSATIAGLLFAALFRITAVVCLLLAMLQFAGAVWKRLEAIEKNVG